MLKFREFSDFFEKVDAKFSMRCLAIRIRWPQNTSTDNFMYFQKNMVWASNSPYGKIAKKAVSRSVF